MFKKNIAITGFTFGLVATADGSDVTTGTPVGYYTLDGGTQTAIGDTTPVHEGNGQWSFDLLAAEMNGDIVGLTFTHASAITVHFTIKTDTSIASDIKAETALILADTTTTLSQLSGITNVGSAVHKPAVSYTLTTGTQSANLFSDTQALNGTLHTHTDVGNAIEFYYEFNIGSGTPSSVQVTGYVNGGNDDIGVYAYDWVATAWVQIGTFNGKNNTTNDVNSYDLFVDMVGSGANEGVVRVRFYAASGLTSAIIAIDQIFTAFSQGSEGYDNGSVWLDTNASNTNVVVGIDGVSRNPVSTIAAANTLLASTNLHRIEVAPGSSFTLAASQTDETFTGHDWTLALGGQDISGSVFTGATVSGVGTSGAGEVRFTDCDINAMSIGVAHFHACGFSSNTITLTAAGSYVMNHCFSQVAGTGTPVIDFGAALGNTNLNIAHYSNGIEISNLNATGSDNFSISGLGQIIYSASSSGTVNQRGMWRVTNTGGVTINEDDNTSNLAAVLVDTADMQPKLGTPSGTDMSADIADLPIVAEFEARTPTAAQLAYITRHAATAKPVTFTGGTTTTAILGNVDGVAASTTNDVYNSRLLVFNAGTLDEQVCQITAYVGSTKTATISAVTTAVTSSHTAVLV